MLRALVSALLITVAGAVLGLLLRDWMRGESARLLVSRGLVVLAGLVLAAYVIGGSTWMGLLGVAILITGSWLRRTAR